MAFWGSICFVILAEKLVEQEHFHFIVYYVAIIFLSAYAGLIYMYRRGKRELAIFMALAVVSVEAAVNTTITSVTTTSREAYTRDNRDVMALVSTLEPASDFYRVEKKTRKTKNDGAWMNFPSVSLFSSTANADLTQFFKRMGCEASTNAYSITGSTPLIDSILSVKYALYSEYMPNTDLISYMKESGSTYLYENLYTMPLGFVIPSDLEDNWQYTMDNPAEVQNDLCLMMGCDDVLVREDAEVSGTSCTFRADMTGEYYVFVRNKRIKSVKAVLPAENKTFNNVDRGYLLELGTLAADSEVTLTAEGSEEKLNAEVYRFSERAMISMYEALNKAPWHLTEWSDTKLSGTVDAAEAGVLFTSIPYEDGWTVLIDGEEAETQKVFEAFLSVNIPAGTHEITMTYFPGGLALGGIISGSAVVILILLYLGVRFEKKRRVQSSRRQPLEADQKQADGLEEQPEITEDTTKEETT